jgi:hypothetical protein
MARSIRPASSRQASILSRMIISPLTRLHGACMRIVSRVQAKLKRTGEHFANRFKSLRVFVKSAIWPEEHAVLAAVAAGGDAVVCAEGTR